MAEVHRVRCDRCGAEAELRWFAPGKKWLIPVDWFEVKGIVTHQPPVVCKRCKEALIDWLLGMDLRG